MYQYLQLKLGDLLISLDNPRYESVEHQREAIEVMLREQKEKIVELGKHIIDHGLSPIDIILVKPMGDLWVVREGNRRITALKLLATPSLVPDNLTKLQKAFRGLAANIDPQMLEQIPCVYCDDEKEANEWIRLKHTGENAGAGTVAWNPQQSGRFSLLTSDKPAPKMVFLEELKSLKGIPEDLRKRLPQMPKTNFERLISDSSVRDFVGINYENGHFILQEPVSDEFLLMISDLLGDELKVNKIYYKKDRAEYIRSIEKRLDNGQGSENIYEKSEGTNSQKNKNAATHDADRPSTSSEQNEDTKKKAYPINRNTLIPSVCSMPINAGRLSVIFRELKSLPLDKYPNAAAVLLRVFVELTVDSYIGKKHIAGVSANSELGKKVEAVAADLESRGIMSKHELLAARKMATGQYQTQSVQTFHSYIHNANITPIARDLRSAWDDISKFIDSIWREI